MKNIKELEEKRNALFSQAQEMLAKEDIEQRDVEKVKEIKEEIRHMDEMLKEAKEIRSNAIEEKGEENVEKENVQELEKRAFDQYLRGRETAEVAEYRALDNATKAGITEEGTPGNGGLGISTTVYNEIIKKMGEEAPVFQSARKFPSMSGNLKVLRESALKDEGFIGEANNATIAQQEFKSVTLTQKRVGTAVQLTQQLINDAAFDVTGYSQEWLQRKLARTIEKGILVGKSDATTDDSANSFKSVIKDTDVVKRAITTKGATITTDELMDVYASLNPAYLDGAMFVVSRKVFNIMTKLQDGDGRMLVFQNILGARPGYTFLGVPVYVSDALNEAEYEMVFGNFAQGYGLLTKQNMSMKVINSDTTQALAGGELIVLDTYMDGAVINPDCFTPVKLGE